MSIEALILTAGHCIAHKDNGFIQKMDGLRVRVPIPDIWDTAIENKARNREKDPRFYDFLITDRNTFHFFPDYEHEGNPNTGDDLGFIQLPQENILAELEKLCFFWHLPRPRDRKRIQFSADNHKGNNKLFY